LRVHFVRWGRHNTAQASEGVDRMAVCRLVAARRTVTRGLDGFRGAVVAESGIRSV